MPYEREIGSRSEFLVSGSSFNESLRRLQPIIYLNVYLWMINEKNEIQIGTSCHELCHG
jgi:hypothetical protein